MQWLYMRYQHVRVQAARLQARAERTARGEADHSLRGLLLYGLSTIFMSAMMILVKQLGPQAFSLQPVLVVEPNGTDELPAVSVKTAVSILNLFCAGGITFGGRGDVTFAYFFCRAVGHFGFHRLVFQEHDCSCVGLSQSVEGRQ